MINRSCLVILFIALAAIGRAQIAPKPLAEILAVPPVKVEEVPAHNGKPPRYVDCTFDSSRALQQAGELRAWLVANPKDPQAVSVSMLLLQLNETIQVEQERRIQRAASGIRVR